MTVICNAQVHTHEGPAHCCQPAQRCNNFGDHIDTIDTESGIAVVSWSDRFPGYVEIRYPDLYLTDDPAPTEVCS